MAFGALCQPAVLQVEQPFLPRVFALAKAVVRRHPFLLPPSRGAHHHPNTLPFRFQADGEVDPAHPEVRVSLAGQGSLAPRGEILRPTLLEPHDPRGGRSPGRSPFESAARSRGRCEPPGGGRPRPVGPHAVRCRCPPPYPSLNSTPALAVMSIEFPDRSTRNGRARARRDGRHGLGAAGAPRPIPDARVSNFGPDGKSHIRRIASGDQVLRILRKHSGPFHVRWLSRASGFGKVVGYDFHRRAVWPASPGSDGRRLGLDESKGHQASL